MIASTDAVLALRKRGGYMQLPDYGVIAVSGRDAASYLQGRVSNDVLLLAPGSGHMTSLLDRKAHMLAYFALERLVDQIPLFWIVAERHQLPLIIEQLETYHFSEKVEFIDRSNELAIWSVQGPEVETFCFNLFGEQYGQFQKTEFAVSQAEIGGTAIQALRRSLTGEAGYLLIGPAGETAWQDTIKKQASSLGFIEPTPQTLETARIEAGLPLYGKDLSANDLMPETGLENSAASYSKGCFIGQEILARVRTYGAPRRGLVGLIIEGDTTSGAVPSGKELTIGAEPFATITSCTYSPTMGKTIALAYVGREFRVPDKSFDAECGGQKFKVTVKSLPFYSAPGAREHAQALYESALSQFAAEGGEEPAIATLRKAIAVDPHLSDAYEALGVILSKLDQLDDAIAVMQKLEAIDPNSVMAHANLSVFYMQKGDKEKAEEEKAIAMSLRMMSLAKEASAERAAEEDKERKRAENLERMGMFKQVLEIDSEDFLANYGLGSVHVDLGQFAEALPYLRKTLQVKPNHTVAYVALGRAYEELGQPTEALAIYEAGIAVASQRGDITPLKEMQSRQQELLTPKQ